MATILIVAPERRAAEHLVRTLREAGHTPLLAPEARAALEDVLDRPDLILLDLEALDLAGSELLLHVKSQPETAAIPVLVLAERPDAAATLRGPERGVGVAILRKPVSGAQLRQAVETALVAHSAPDPEARQRQGELIRRLILEGPDPLVFHVYRRLCADRAWPRSPLACEALSWTEISQWAKREGLLDAEQARLLRRISVPPPGTIRRAGGE